MDDKRKYGSVMAIAVGVWFAVPTVLGLGVASAFPVSEAGSRDASAVDRVGEPAAQEEQPKTPEERRSRRRLERGVQEKCSEYKKRYDRAEKQVRDARRGSLEQALQARDAALKDYCKCLTYWYADAGLELPPDLEKLCGSLVGTAPAEPGDPPGVPAPPEAPIPGQSPDAIQQRSPDRPAEDSTAAPEEPRPRPAPRSRLPARVCQRQFDAYLRTSQEYDLAGPRRSDSRRRYAELLEAFNDWCDCLKEKAPAEYERLCRNGLVGFPPPEDSPGTSPSGPTDAVRPPSVPQTPQAPNAPGVPAPNAPSAPCEGASRMPATHSGNATVRFTQHGSDHAKHCNVCLLLIRGFYLMIERNGCDVTMKAQLAPETPPLSFQCQASEVAANLREIEMMCGPIQGQFCLMSPDVILDNAKIVDGVVKEFDLTFRYATPGGPETLTVRVTPPPLPEM